MDPARRRRGESWGAFGYLVPALVVFGLFMFYPLVRSVLLSVQGSDIFGRPSGFVGAQNYASLFADGAFGQVLAVTAGFTLLTVLPALLLALGLALLLNQRIRAVRFFRTGFAVPFAFSVATASVEAADGVFELGVGYYPKLEQNESGPIIGGASLWINGPGHEAAEQEAAWRFIQFLAEPESQATWHTGTGYFPISQAALELPEDVEWREQYPQFDVAVQQLQDTELNTATQGCALGVMPQARKASEDGLEQAVLGDDAQTAMTGAADGLAGQIEEYNSSTD